MLRVPNSSSACTMQRFRPAVFSIQHAAWSAAYARAARAEAAPKSKAAADESSPLTMSKLVEAVADQTGYVNGDVESVTNSVLETIMNRVAAGQSVKIAGFGTFKRVETSARAGRNPATGEPLQIAASARASFTTHKKFKDLVKEGWKKGQK